jgi:hypothetical protein
MAEQNPSDKAPPVAIARALRQIENMLTSSEEAISVCSRGPEAGSQPASRPYAPRGHLPISSHCFRFRRSLGTLAERGAGRGRCLAGSTR